MRVQTHNGCITVVSRKSGKHRTIKVATEQWSDGTTHRVVSLLIGPDNSKDFIRFGEVVGQEVRVWKHFSGKESFDWFARALADMPAFARQAEFLCEGRCRRCGRKLTTPASIESGIGPVCEGAE